MTCQLAVDVGVATLCVAGGGGQLDTLIRVHGFPVQYITTINKLLMPVIIPPAPCNHQLSFTDMMTLVGYSNRTSSVDNLSLFLDCWVSMVFL